MTALLNWRIWAVLALAGLLAFTHLTAYRKGAQHVRTEWQQATAEANAEARRLEQARQRRADEAAQMAAQREARIRADAVRVAGERDGLRDDIRAVREHASHSLDACTVSLAAATDVFEQCGRRLGEVAQDADRHAADSLKLQQAWPN